MEIIVVTSPELLEEVYKLVETFTEFNWASYQFKAYDYEAFERTAEYTKLSNDENWLGDYGRAKRGINRNHWSFWLKKDQIRFVLIDPFASPGWRLNSFAHEIAHMSLREDDIVKLVGKQLNHQLMKELRKKLDAKADRGQLLNSAVHVIIFPEEIIADRWVAEKSRSLLADSLEEACSVWHEARKHAADLPYSLGPVLVCLRQYLSMQLKVSLAQEYQISDGVTTLSAIIQDYEKVGLVKLVVERANLWKLASNLKIVEYTDKCIKVVRRLAKTVPLKPSKATYMPPIHHRRFLA
ncbi:hypothetical protein MUP07_03070 [Candidatus Bathyarchaeota archaeon]|nr:hypothetical protein [Candidatus Bathyarchaeota archaeon]